MNSLKDFAFKTFYSRTDSDSDIAADFFMPCMENSIAYDRITGFFGSSVYIIIWGALRHFIEHGGRMRILCSPRISTDDRNAINSGLESKGSPVVVESLRNELESMMSDADLVLPARILSCMIATSILEIRIVTTDYDEIPLNYKSMFHDKIGIFKDAYGNMVTFGGSMNETFQGLSSTGNSETVAVNISWDPGRDGQRTLDYASHFEDIWNKKAPNVKVFDLPNEIREVFEEYAKDSDILDLLNEIRVTTPVSKQEPLIVGRYELKSYQAAAYNSWVSNGRRGILKHATGSGKTVTGMYCIKKSLENGEVPLIIVPSVDLQNQWRDNIAEALPSVKMLLCGGSDTTSWKKPLRSWSSNRDGTRLIIAVLNTVSTDAFMDRIKQGNHLFVLADEVHRLGSSQFRKALELDSGPRLGLSATPERFRDREGTEAIFSYFGPIVHRFDLEDAIKANRLTEYYYHPIQTHLSPKEIEDWDDLSRRISRAVSYSEKPDPIDDERVKHLLIMRSRIAKNAEAKIGAAVEIINSQYKAPQRWLVYCDNAAQMDGIRNHLKNSIFNVMKYYSGMEGDRKRTIEYFTNYGGIILSIKCLDEGVDIPVVSHALIVASSQNPREYIQRRGRVLRLSSDKPYSVIYDLVVMPDGVDCSNNMDSLIAGELARAIKFGEHAINANSCVTDLRVLALDLGIDPETAYEFGEEELDQ